jgi:hypothetical protein
VQERVNGYPTFSRKARCSFCTKIFLEEELSLSDGVCESCAELFPEDHFEEQDE